MCPDFFLGKEELATAMLSREMDSKHKSQELHLTSFSGSGFRYDHFATGKIVSAMEGDYDDVIVVLLALWKEITMMLLWYCYGRRL